MIGFSTNLVLTRIIFDCLLLFLCTDTCFFNFQMGAKKAGGMGAQKVKKDFAEIEREAELADQVTSEIFSYL
jgi:hypothetical protein